MFGINVSFQYRLHCLNSTQKKNCVALVFFYWIVGSIWYGSLHQWSHFLGLQFHEQLYQWSWSRFDKSFGKTVPHIEFLKICSHRMPCRMRWIREKPLFLAPSHPKALWEHVFRGFISGAVSFYPIWQKTAPNGSWSRWRSPTKRGLIIHLNMNLVVRFVLISFGLPHYLFMSLVSQHHFFTGTEHVSFVLVCCTSYFKMMITMAVLLAILQSCQLLLK
jgi:hypothetical protein